MATRTATKKPAPVKIEWPKNLSITGNMSFPLYTDQNIADLEEWRTTKSIKKPKFADRIGGSLLVTERTLESVADYLENTYLPFVDTLYKDTDGDKGIEPDLVAELMALVKARNWSEKNLPIRDLTDKERENADEKYVGKVRFSGPYDGKIKGPGPIRRKAIVTDNGERVIVSIDSLVDDDVLPEGYTDSEQLWWGSGWDFRTSLRFNAYDTANTGVSAYAQTVFLLPERGLPTFGGGNDAEVLEDGDDWYDED